MTTLLACLLLALHGAGRAAPPAPTVQASPPRKMVWVHSMTCFPLDLKWLPSGYGQTYPLRQELGLERRTGLGWVATDIEDAKRAGIDGFSVDVFTGDDRNYLEQADKVGGFLIAPCLDLSGVPDGQKEAVAVRTIENNVKIARGHPSAARVGDALVVFTYGTGMITPDGWRRVRARLDQDTCRVYIVAAAEASGDLGVMRDFPGDVMARYIPLFEAGYSFGSTGPHWGETVSLYRRSGRPFAGGMMPGYDRETPNGGYADARGTAVYREEWHRHLAARLDWACVSTWNDLAENTELLPDSDWNWTRADLTRWFSAKFKGLAPPWARPRLYVTTPKAVYRRGAYLAEGLVLNASPAPVRVSVQLTDGAGCPVAKPVAATVAPGQDGAALAPIRLAGFPTGRFLRARATVTQGGRTLAFVLSAPILVLDETSQPGYRLTYYSVPADKALPGPVAVALDGRPTGGQTGRVRVKPPPGARPRFVEVLHNGEQVKNFFDRGPFVVSVPGRAANGAVVGLTDWGFYTARVTDENMRVGYSDPVYVAPPGDVSLWEKFSFDEGAGKTALDSSLYGKVADLDDVEWAAPGFGGRGACVRLDGTTSRVRLSAYKTPTGPFSLTLAARPAKLGGFLYGDGGGLVIEIRPDGTLRFSLNTVKGWTAIQGRTPLRVGEWARLEFTNDGGTSRLFVNGSLDAEGPSLPLKDSGNPMIGGNPYGGGAYAGDIDDFALRALPAEATHR